MNGTRTSSKPFGGEVQPSNISFESPALLFKVLSGKRWDLLQIMAGAGEMSIRELARRAGRDVKGVHGDVQKLLNAGILDKIENGKIEFLFDALHVDFTVKTPRDIPGSADVSPAIQEF